MTLTENDLELLSDACLTAIDHYQGITIPRLQVGHPETLVELGYEGDESPEQIKEIISDVEGWIEGLQQLLPKLTEMDCHGKAT